MYQANTKTTIIQVILYIPSLPIVGKESGRSCNDTNFIWKTKLSRSIFRIAQDNNEEKKKNLIDIHWMQLATLANIAKLR